MGAFSTVNKHVAFYLAALAPLFAIASKFDMHDKAGMVLGLGAMAASLAASLNAPPGVASPVTITVPAPQPQTH